MALASQAEFAALHGVSRKTATIWKQSGLLVFSGDKVDVEASDARLREKRVGRFKDVTGAAAVPLPAGNKGGNALPVTPSADADPDAVVASLDEFIGKVLAGDFATLLEAERVKENALALKHVLDARQKAGALVDIETATTVLFEVSRAARDSWLNWPARVGPLLAADLGLEADKVTEALTTHVHKHLEELGEPEVEFTDREA